MRIISFVILLLLFIGCGDEPGDLTSPVLKEPVVTPDMVMFEVPAGNIRADGTDFKQVKLTISGTYLKDKAVTFTISPVGVFDNGKDTFTTPLNASNEATTKILSTKEGKAIVMAKIDEVEKPVTITFEKMLPVNNLSFSNPPTIPLADNYSTAELIVTADLTNGVAQDRKVKFVTDKGTFHDGSKEYTANISTNNIAKAYLKHNKAELVRVTAIIADTYPIDTHVQFVQALPEQIFVFPETNTIAPKLDSKIKITAKLVRDKGTVSDGQVVIFEDEFGNGGPSVGSFLSNTLSDSSGEVSATYQLTNANLTGLPKLLYMKAYITDKSDPANPVKRKLGENTIVIQ
ncbi:hypothetical protein LXM25_16395 [Dyadobacter sp. LJ53]|uniref:hypothetical protein n=1 Tax=Dyadobacter chenwenxiniae TaxID=2906456 RepID=UPI001F277F29|nr:hypothetical protein [Dyadobacter chenwenxiniae]MCF0051650.1 hypothetical protein [Dyadobacter chenwenxiniae]